MADHLGRFGTNWLQESRAVQPLVQNASMPEAVRPSQNLVHTLDTKHANTNQASVPHDAPSPAPSNMDWTPTHTTTTYPQPAFATNPAAFYPQHFGTLNYQPNLQLPAGNKSRPARCLTDLRHNTLANGRQTFGRPSETLKLLKSNLQGQNNHKGNGRIRSAFEQHIPRKTHANLKQLHIDRKASRPRLPIDSTRPYYPLPPVEPSPEIQQQPLPQVPASPRPTHHPQIRRVLNPQDATAKYVYDCATQTGTPQVASAIPGGFPTTPAKRSFDEYAADRDTKFNLAGESPITGREDYVEPCRPGTNVPQGIFRSWSIWLAERSSSLLSGFITNSLIFRVASGLEKARSLLSRSTQGSYDVPTPLNVTAKSHKRHITMPGAFPEFSAMIDDIASVKQTESVSNNVPRADAQSPAMLQSLGSPSIPPLMQQAGEDRRSPPGLRSAPSPASPRAAATGQLSMDRLSRLPKEKSVDRSFGWSEMRQSRLAHTGRPAWQQSAKLETPEWPRISREQKWARHLGSSLSSSIGASSAVSSSPRHEISSPAAPKASKETLFRSSILLPQLPPSGQYAESESRPTSSGSDSSVIVDPLDTVQNIATSLEAVTMPTDVESSFIVGELQRSVRSQTDKLAAEEARRRQQLEEKAREEKRALEERQAREKAEIEKRKAAAAAAEAARLAEREAALKAMTEHERWVFDRSSGLFGALPQAHADTLQDLAQKSDAYDIKGNFKSKDLRSMIGPNPSRAFDRPWLNDEAVCKATDMLCLRANEKAGFSKQMKAKGRPAPFHAYTPMWFTSINSFGEGSMKSWGRRANHLGDNLFHTQAVFLPICDKSHWRLVVIFGQNRTIHYFDSLGCSPRQYVSTAKRLMSVFMGDHWNESDWTVVQEQASPRQGNSSDCGMFVIVNAANILRGRTVLPSSYDPQPEVIDHARRWFASAIVNGGFTGDFDWEDERVIGVT